MVVRVRAGGCPELHHLLTLSVLCGSEATSERPSSGAWSSNQEKGVSGLVLHIPDLVPQSSVIPDSTHKGWWLLHSTGNPPVRNPSRPKCFVTMSDIFYSSPHSLHHVDHSGAAMNVTNALYPPKEQFEEFFATGDDGPYVMVNLLKFRDKAVYEDDPSIDITGREAYEIYGEAVTRLVEAGGGRILHTGDVTGLILGEVEEMWDVVALAEYPSNAAFMEMMMSPEWAAIERHRTAGLAGQLNIRTVVRPS